MIELKPGVEIGPFFPSFASRELSCYYLLISFQSRIDGVANPNESDEEYLFLVETFELEVDHLLKAYLSIAIEVKIRELILELSE